MTEELRMVISSIQLNRYPDQDATALRRALSDYSGFPADWITVGNGGDELIAYLMTAFVPSGGCLITLSPSFSGYEHQSRALDVRTSEVPLEYRDGSIFLDTEKLIDRLAASSPDLVIIDRPNNPTGLSLSLDLLKEIASLTRGSWQSTRPMWSSAGDPSSTSAENSRGTYSSFGPFPRHGDWPVSGLGGGSADRKSGRRSRG